MRALLVALLLAAPAVAQSTSDEPAARLPVQAPAIDPGVVGTWALDEAEALGFLGELGVAIDAMTVAFRADGTADVTMTVTQDDETTQTARTFAFATADGRIVPADDTPMAYRVLDDGRLRMSDPQGLVLVFARLGE